MAMHKTATLVLEPEILANCLFLWEKEKKKEKRNDNYSWNDHPMGFVVWEDGDGAVKGWKKCKGGVAAGQHVYLYTFSMLLVRFLALLWLIPIFVSVWYINKSQFVQFFRRIQSNECCDLCTLLR